MSTAAPLKPVEETQQEPEVVELTANDRCDHGDCNAQAYYRCHLLNGFLIFCRHHYLTLEDTLGKQAIMIEDFTYLLD